jgi:hypothetical protein
MSCWDNYDTEEEAILNCETQAPVAVEDNSSHMFDVFGAVVLTALIVSLIAAVIGQTMTIDRVKSELKKLKGETNGK